MRLLFTGASGFLGRNVRSILKEQYDLCTIGLTESDDIEIDISTVIPDLNEYFDIVLHAAGKAHVIPNTQEEEKMFFDINYQGTVNLCKALEKSGIPKVFIFISTVAVYGCDFGENITEEHPLKGDTPYALSKIQAESFLMEWCGRNKVKLGILRPSLLAGPNAPGNLGTMIKGIKSGRYLSIGGGKAEKSVLMVEDVARLIPLLIEKGGIYNVCDNNNPTFRELEELIVKQLGKSKPLSIPVWVARCLALMGDCLGKRAPINSLKLKKITESLTFSNEKAKRELGWEPLDVLSHFKIR